MRTLGRLREAYEEHRDLVLLALLFLVFRFLSLLLFRPGGFILEWSGYYLPEQGFVELSDKGLYPFLDYWMEYPPLYPYLALLAYRLSLLIPAWVDPRLWFNLILGTFLLPFETGNLLLIYALARGLYDRPGALRCAWLYALLFAPLFTLLGWFDCFPLFFLLLTLYLARQGRAILSGLATGIGFMVKPFPLLAAPVALRLLTKGKVLYLALAFMAASLIVLPFLLLNAPLLWASFVNMLSRPPWETIWALMEGFYGGGAVTPLEAHFDPQTAILADRPSTLPWPWITLGFALLYLFLYTRPIAWSDKRKSLAFAGLTVNLFFIYSKGWSPQFLAYLLPFLVLLLPNFRGVIYALLLTGSNFLEFPLSLVMLPGVHWLLASAVIFRTLLLALISLECALLLWPSAIIQKVWKGAFATLLALALLGGPLVGVGALRAYRSEKFNQDPYKEAMAFLHSQPPAALVFTDRSLYLRFYPFMGGGKRLYLLEDGKRIEQRLAGMVKEHLSIWVVHTGEEGATEAMQRWLSEEAFPLTSKWFSNCRLDNYATATITPFLPLETNFENLILLEGYALGEGPLQSGGVLPLALKWKALTSMDKGYTVFVHLLDSSGQLVSQHDAQPVGGFRPTSSWKPGEEVIDRHGLPLAIPPGDYWLRVGLYEAESGERLQVIDEQGGEGVLIGPVTVTGGKDSEP